MGLVKNVDQIVSAADRVFRRKGLVSARVEDVAAELGILKGSLYYHVPSKSGLVALVVERLLERLIAHIRCARLVAGDPTEVLRAAVLDLVTQVHSHPYLFSQRSVWAHSPRETSVFSLTHDSYLAYADELAGVLADFRAAHSSEPVTGADLVLAAHAIVGMVARPDSAANRDDCAASATIVMALVTSGIMSPERPFGFPSLAVPAEHSPV